MRPSRVRFSLTKPDLGDLSYSAAGESEI